jgi:2-phospho-L-lactate guanylyltransferase
VSAVSEGDGTFAVLPVKGFDSAKARLADSLDSDTRQRLAEAMLEDVLSALDQSRMLGGRILVTGDDRAASIAWAHDWEVVPDPGGIGHSGAALLGIEAALGEGARRVVLLPGDCPLLDARELDQLLATIPDEGVAIVRDRHLTGTNALVISPPGAIEPAFGEGSAERHRDLAREAGVLSSFEDLSSLALDIDEPTDLVALEAKLEAGMPGARATARVIGG